MQTIQEILTQTIQQLEKIYEAAKVLMSKVSTHKANPSMVKDIILDYHGVNSRIEEVASISVEGTHTLKIDPWDKNLLQNIQVAIVKAKNTDLNPQNTGDVIRITLPLLTGERRVQLAKKIQTEAENTKIKIRQERQKSNKHIEELKIQGTSEDEIKRSKSELQKHIEKYIKKVDELQDEIIKQVSKL
ncbi:MAG: ribosome-recycling factor [Bacteroidota bacterium]